MSIPEDPRGSTSTGTPVVKMGFDMPQVPSSSIKDVQVGKDDVLPRAVGAWRKFDRRFAQEFKDNYQLDLLIRLLLVTPSCFHKVTHGPKTYSLRNGTFLWSNAYALQRLYPHENLSNVSIYTDLLGRFKKQLADLAQSQWIDYGFGKPVGYEHECVRVTIKHFGSMQSSDAKWWIKLHAQLLDCDFASHSRNLAWFARLSTIANRSWQMPGFCDMQHVKEQFNHGLVYTTEIERLQQELEIRMEIPGVVVRVNEPEGMLLKQFVELQGIRPAKPRLRVKEKVVNGGPGPLTSLKLFGIE